MAKKRKLVMGKVKATRASIKKAIVEITESLTGKKLTKEELEKIDKKIEKKLNK